MIIREEVLVAMRDRFAAVDGIKQCEREHPAYADIKNKTFPTTSMPFIGILGGLPVPENGEQYKAGNMKSLLHTELLFIDNCGAGKPYCTLISNWANKLWIEAHKDPKWGIRQVTETRARFSSMPGIKAPLIAFYLFIDVLYVHNSEGI